MKKVYAAIVQERQNDKVLVFKVNSSKEGNGKELYSRKCWDNPFAIDTCYEVLVQWLLGSGYKPVYSNDMVLYWEKVVEV